MHSQPARPTSSERALAALAHLAGLVHGLGIPLPAYIWSERRKDSPYLSFQALQAYAYQSLGYTVWVLIALGLAVLGLFGLVAVDSFAPIQQPIIQDLLSKAGFLLSAFFGIYNLLAVIAAIACALGWDFRYPLIGRWLTRYLSRAPASPASPALEQDQRFAIAMGHFAVIFPFTGLLGPLVLWIIQGKNSPALRAQSIQTVIYQAIGSVFYTASHTLPLLMIFPLFLGLFSFGNGPEATLFNPFTIILAFFGLCLLSLALLLGPLYHIFGQWAGLQTLLGRDFNYPLIQRFLANWEKSSPANPDLA